MKKGKERSENEQTWRSEVQNKKGNMNPQVRDTFILVVLESHRSCDGS